MQNASNSPMIHEEFGERARTITGQKWKLLAELDERGPRRKVRNRGRNSRQQGRVLAGVVRLSAYRNELKNRCLDLTTAQVAERAEFSRSFAAATLLAIRIALGILGIVDMMPKVGCMRFSGFAILRSGGKGHLQREYQKQNQGE